MNLFGCTRLHRQDATRLRVAPGNLRGEFTHVFMDPPYNKGLWRPVLLQLKKQSLLAENGVIILEVAADEEIDSRGFTVQVERVWGAARVLFMTVDNDAAD